MKTETLEQQKAELAKKEAEQEQATAKRVWEKIQAILIEESRELVYYKVESNCKPVNLMFTTIPKRK